jgi:hypothetical protein
MDRWVGEGGRWLVWGNAVGGRIVADSKAEAFDISKLPGIGGIFNSRNLALFTYGHQNPIRLKDPDGNDVWVEGPSNNEPPTHRSINVGDPNGEYLSISFGTNLQMAPMGNVYQDQNPNGKIIEGMYLTTTKQEDDQVKEIFIQKLFYSDQQIYGPENCINFSNDLFNKIRNEGIGKLTSPPAVSPERSNYNVFKAIFNRFQNLFSSTK